jgi:hypothetical protein
MYTSACGVFLSITSTLMDYEKRLPYIQTIHSAGGIDAVLAAVQRHIKDEPLVKEAIKALISIMNTLSYNRTRVPFRDNILVSAVKTTVRVLIEHKHNCLLLSAVFTLL